MGTILYFEAAQCERDPLYRAERAMIQAAVEIEVAAELHGRIEVLRELHKELGAAIEAAAAVGWDDSACD